LGDKWETNGHKRSDSSVLGALLLPMILSKTVESKTKITFYFAFPSLNRIFAKRY
jgi:hypothetical protein